MQLRVVDDGLADVVFVDETLNAAHMEVTRLVIDDGCNFRKIINLYDIVLCHLWISDSLI